MTSRFGWVGRFARVAALGVAGLVAMAPTGAGAVVTSYYWQVSNNVSYGGVTTNYNVACSTIYNVTAEAITTMDSTGAFGCASNTNNRLYSTVAAGSSMLLMVKPTAYTAATTVTGQTATTFRMRTGATGETATVAFQLGYVDGTGFHQFTNQVPQAITATSTLYSVNLSSITGSAPAGSYAAFRAVITAKSNSAGVVRFYMDDTTTGDNSFRIPLDEVAAAGTAPGTPGTPSLTAIGAAGLTATWTASPTGTTPITYTLYQDTSSTGTFATASAGGCSGASLLTCNVTGLSSNTTYYFRVTASNGTLPNANSLVSAGGLTLPAAMTAAPTFGTVTSSSIVVNWTAPTGGAASYDLEYADNAGFTGSTTVSSIAATTYTVNTLNPSVTYYFQVRPRNATGLQATPSPVGNQATSAGATAPGTPGTPALTAIGAAGLTATWTASPTGTTPITYTLYQDTSSTGTFATASAGGCSGASLLTCNVTGLSSNTTYYFRVTASNGTAPNANSAVSAGGLTLPAAMTAAPTFGTVTSSSIVVNWAAPTGGAASYDLEYANNTGFTGSTTVSSIAATTYTVNSLTASTTYYFRVRPRNATGLQATPSPTGTQATGAAGTAPGTPGTPALSAIGATGLTATWTASPTGTTPITYTLYQDTSSTGTFATASAGGCSGASLLTCNVTGLSSNTTYYFRVTASNGTAPNANSAVSAGGLTLPAAMTAAPTFGTVTSSSIVVNWAAPTGGAASYDLEYANNSAFTGSTTVSSIAATTYTVNTLAASTTYYFRVRPRNATGLQATPSPVGNQATSAGVFVRAGSMTSGTTLPVVSIVNPMPNAVVKSPFKVQARVFSPVGGGNVGTVTLYVDGTAYATALSPSAYYGTSATSGIWWVQVDGLVAGAHTLRVRATNASVDAPGYVDSTTFNVTVPTSAGDGRLLVRDNSSQLCADCHGAVMTHSSEATGSKYGSWAISCRECHDPHGTRNLGLIAESIKPPEVNVATTAKTALLYNLNAGYTTGATPSGFANDAGTGVCQVCHTRTTYYGPLNGTTHNSSSACINCHKHTKGLSAICTDCHGNATRTSIANADLRQTAAPPVVAALAAVSVANGGVHVKHVNQATYRTNPLQCADCHTGAAHQTNHQVDIGYSALAKTAPAPINPAEGALNSAWTTTPTCTNWCHGNGMPNSGGAVASWNWNGGVTVTCSSCHGGPPPVNGTTAYHPQNPTCASCHGAGYATTGLTAAAKATHVDGTLSKPSIGCTACHGALAGLTGAAATNTDPSAAPGYNAAAVDTQGATSGVYVGAHQAHVNPSGHSATPMMSAKGCAVCHPLPANGTKTHANNSIGFAWTAPANSGGIAPTPTAAIGKPSTTAATCTNYCHSNAKPVNGTVSTPSFVWNAAGGMICTSCHQTATFGGTGLSAKHQKHLQTAAPAYPFTCDECHSATIANDSSSSIATPANHVNGVKDVAFSTTAVNAAINQSGGAYNAAAYTCSSTYCHSGGVAIAAPFSPTASAAIPWNTAGTTTCQTCHGFNNASRPTMGVATGSLFAGSAAHMNHVDNASFIGTNYFCGDCHQNTVAAGTDSPIATAANHVNGTKTVAIAPRGGFTTTPFVYAGTCATVYCHSSGQRAPTYRSINWTGAAIGCNGCHGTTTTTGAPDYGATNQPDTATSNSHPAHVGSSADCATCHFGFVNGTGTAINGALHTNGIINVAFNTAKATVGTFTSGTYTPPSTYTSATCTTVSCHGNNATALKWGGPAQTCLGCHGTTGVETNDLGASFWNNGVAATINTTEWAYSGHGKASGTYDVTLNPAAAFPTTPTAGLSECMYCHDKSIGHGSPTNPFRLRGVTDVNGVSAPYNVATAALANSVCLNCHSASANGVDPDGTAAAYTKKVATLKDPGIHAGAKHSVATLGGRFCWDCHDPHGDRPNSTTNNIAMLGNSVTAVSDGTYGYVGSTGVQRAITYNTEAASPPATGKAVELTTAAGTQHIGVCQACHADTTDTLLAATAWTKYWNRLGRDDPDGVGGAAPTNSGTTSHNYGSTTVAYCISCHSHKSGFGGECVGCHATTQPVTKGPLAGTATRDNIVAEFKNTWSHKSATNATPANITVTNADCAVCHMEANSPADPTPSGVHGDGYVNLRDPDTGVNIKGVTWGGTGAGAYTSTAVDAAPARFSRNLASNVLEADTQAIMINQCLHCHDLNGASNANAQVPGGSAGKPFATTIPATQGTYTGASGYTACTGGVGSNPLADGCVVNLARDFNTTNSSYHPILGKQNNSYTQGTRMATPWNITKTNGNTTSWGYLMTCWDCHAPNGTASTVTLTRTVTAHGGATTVRGTPTTSGTPTSATAVTLCVLCHAGYNTCTTDNHCAGSAFSSVPNQGFQAYTQYGCNVCHSAGYTGTTAPVRPVRAQDSHGVNALPPTPAGVTLAGRWATGTDKRPYAFIRNTDALGNHEPKQIGATVYTSANCNMPTGAPTSYCANQGTQNYTAGGTY